MKPVFYLLMRNDLESMTPGKLAAQASHVTNAFMEDIKNHCNNDLLNEMFCKWTEKTEQGFGTAICLSVNKEEIQDIKKWLLEYTSKSPNSCGVFNMVYDPTYPHKIPKSVADDLLLRLNNIDHIDAQKGIYTKNELVAAYMFVDSEHADFQWIKEFPLW